MTETSQKKEVKRIINHEKIKVLLIPVVLFSAGFGFQLLLEPGILLRYDWFHLIKNTINANAIGLLFMLLPIAMLVGFFSNQRRLLLVCSAVLMMLWTILTLSFLISPPPNTTWLYTSLMVYLTYSLATKV